MNRFAKIKDIAVLNKETFKKDSFPNIIKYLDTGSLTKNKIEGFQLLNTKSEKIPSRAQRKVFTNTILYSTVRPNQEHYGIIERNFKDIVVSTGFTTIDITDENTYPKYIYYLLTQKSITDYLHTIGMNAVSSYPSISPNDIGNLKFKLPDLPTQKSIAKVLSDLDSKIELNSRINQELEAMAKTLYDYWFVQFDFPNPSASSGQAGKPYKSSGGKMVYNTELKREIPEGWEVKKLGKVLSTKLGGTPSTEIKEYWDNGEFNWLNSGEIANFPIITSELKITKKAIESSSTYLLPKGTVAISITRHIRPSILAIDSCANQSVIGILESEELKSSYLYPLIRNEIPRYLSLRTGAQQPHINKQTIDKTNIIIPATEILKKYYQASNQYYKKIINNAFQNQQLSALRDWLLPMLMNGQVTVKEAEERLSMAAEPDVEYKNGKKMIFK